VELVGNAYHMRITEGLLLAHPGSKPNVNLAREQQAFLRVAGRSCLTRSSPYATTSRREAKPNCPPLDPGHYLRFDRMKSKTGRLTVSSSVLNELPADP
jgi:hypothetical protein